MIVGNGCPLTTVLRGPSPPAPRRHPVSPHPADSRPRQRRHGRRCDRAWSPGYSPRLGRAPSADAAASRARPPAWPPDRRRSSSPPDRRRRARPARRPARGPAAAPSSPRPLGRRGHAPPPATRVTLASRAPRPAPSPPHAFTRLAPPGASPGLRQAHRARRRAGRGSHCRLCTRGVSWSDDAPHPPPAPPRRASTRRRPPAPPRRCCRWDCVARASRRGHPPP